MLRVGRYLMNFPLWWDESFLAINFLRRDYLGLLKPLDYGQVCPLLFLWVELTVVKLLGFSEWSLRLVPLICAVASVVLFRHTASRVVRGLPLLFAVAIFAVAYHPIRHAADVKPYALDLFVTLVVLTLAIEWWRTPERIGWLWALVGFAPFALALSHPAVFTAGGIGLALLPAVVRTKRCSAWLALALFHLTVLVTFILLYTFFTAAQSSATLQAMQADWMKSFPPLDRPWTLPRWLALIHAGDLLAYPCGGPNGRSAVSLLLVLIAIVMLWRQGRRTVLAVYLAPCGLAMIAAGLKRYPYGGAARFMQYLAPSACLLAGLGAAAVFSKIQRTRLQHRLLPLALTGLALVGIAPTLAELAHPYRSVHSLMSRQFARRFWPALGRGAEVACLRWDFRVGQWNSTRLGIPVALCNQAIYSPQRRRGRGPHWDEISATRPLRCVLCDAAESDEACVAVWLQSMNSRYQLKRRETVVANMAEAGARPRTERYLVFEFVPRAPESGETVAAQLAE
jgi:hypothetical protein